ncbi:alpha/beta fold hydrolase [Rhodoligotrophos defluvii]|uniref:alpha/beta fold hydrolase n=1 Tax=Rhodoligotrophos defluvii TaxID=2561934 RepID=UPI0010C9F44E|nr:alpha/beta fold hydrolase [Rhodoligotrophos defluvii]
MSTISTGRMVVEVAGEGMPVVMVPGLGGTSNTFQPQMEALRGFRVIRPDLPGSGRSPVAPEAQTIETLARTVAETARMLGAERAHFVGHSLGTLVCQRIAVEWPELVASLTLFGALTEPTEAARTGLAARAQVARTDGMEPIADQIVANALSSATRSTQPATVAFVRESVMRQNPEGYARMCEALAKAQAADFRRISAPTLLITGDADVVAPPSMAQMIADKVAGAQLTVLDRAGHWITLERAQDCSERMGGFLRTVQ